jgi:Transposase DDE domain
LLELCPALDRGEIHDSTAASELIERLPAAKAVIADKGYDSEKIREQIKASSPWPADFYGYRCNETSTAPSICGSSLAGGGTKRALAGLLFSLGCLSCMVLMWLAKACHKFKN